MSEIADIADQRIKTALQGKMIKLDVQELNKQKGDE
jgi:hypothetical protein